MNRSIYRLALTGLLLSTTLSVAQEEPATSADRIAALEARLEKLEQKASTPTALQASWQNGIQLNSADGAIKLQIGGRVQNDYAVISGDDEVEEAVGPLKDGTKFRRARLHVAGTLYEHGIFRAEYDFAGGGSVFRDVWMGVRDIPWIGTARVGYMLEPYALEQLCGNNFHHFIERGLPASFYPFRSSGITLNNTVFDKRGTWSVGAYQRVNSSGDFTTNSKYAATARLTAAPVYQNDGRTWMHLGLSYSYRKPDAESYAVSSRPESYIAPVFVRSGAIASDRVQLVGWEWAATHGPVTIQAEYHMASVDTLEGSEDVDLQGYYLTASYFLTGENRTYSRESATIGRIIPRRNFRQDGNGLGAWEVAARYSVLDLNDGPVRGGELRDITLGVNWYLNPNMRLMWNYVRADLKDVGEADIAQMRVQFDF